MKTQIYKTKEDFLNRQNRKENGVSETFAVDNPNFFGYYDKSENLKIPVIENIHQKVLDAVSKPKALEMGKWHTCKTTHCRAGWVVTLAGKEGKELEQKTSTLFAAMQIYRVSSAIKVSPMRFYDSNGAAIKDIKRCAELEGK